jgi:hypothetical protein
MIFQGAIILPHIVVYHKRANKPKKKRLTKMIDVYKHALIGGNGVPHFGPKV